MAIDCRFCKGKGIDPFGIMSKLATCTICGGKKKIIVFEPYVDCKFCKGCGVYPTSRLSCTACSGKGVISVRNKNEKVCRFCSNSGISSPRGAGFWCFYCHGTGLVAKAV